MLWANKLSDPLIHLNIGVQNFSKPMLEIFECERLFFLYDSPIHFLLVTAF